MRLGGRGALQPGCLSAKSMVPALLERGRAWSAHVRRGVCCLASADRLTLARPDDWHLHLRDNEDMQAVLPHSARMFRRAIIMPNLRPPVVSTDQVRRQLV